MTKFLLYTCRHGDEDILLPYTKEAFNWVVHTKMPMCNRITIEQIKSDPDYLGYDGSWEQGYFFIDDGGEIKTIELSEKFE